MIGVQGLASRPAARAACVLVVLWVGTAVLLRGTGQFGLMIPMLAAASAVLWGTGSGRRFIVGQLVLWLALLLSTTVLLSDSASLPGMLALIGAATLWFTVGEPILRARRTSSPGHQ
jgi:hypothetical protein